MKKVFVIKNTDNNKYRNLFFDREEWVETPWQAMYFDSREDAEFCLQHHVSMGAYTIDEVYLVDARD